MNTKGILLILISILASCHSDLLKSDKGATVPTTGMIAGMVKDASTGKPIISANVIARKPFLEETEIRGAVTDSSGRFLITDVPVGVWKLRASALAYQSVQMVLHSIVVERDSVAVVSCIVTFSTSLMAIPPDIIWEHRYLPLSTLNEWFNDKNTFCH